MLFGERAVAALGLFSFSCPPAVRRCCDQLVLAGSSGNERSRFEHVPKNVPLREEGAAAAPWCCMKGWWGSRGVGTGALQEDKHCRRTSTAGQALCCHAAVPQHLSGSRRWGASLEGRAGGRKPLLLRASSEGNAGLVKITGRWQDEQKINSLSTCPEHKSSSLCYPLLLGALTESARSTEGKGSSGSEPPPNLGSSPHPAAPSPGRDVASG